MVEKDNIIIDGNNYTIKSELERAFYLRDRNNVTIKKTHIIGGYWHGIRLSSCGNCVVVNNTITNCEHGIELDGGYNVIKNNIMRNTSSSAISLRGSKNIVGNNTIINCGGGIRCSSSNNVICKNIVTKSVEGICFYDCQNNILVDNIITNNTHCGIYIVSSGKSPGVGSHTICNNTVTNNGYWGIKFWYSGNNTLRNNNITDNGYNFGVYGEVFEGSLLTHFLNDVDTSNTVDGKPIYYWINEHDKQVPEDAGYIALVNSIKVTVKNMYVTKNSEGVLFVSTRNSVIENMTLLNNECGIWLRNSSDNTINNNIVRNHGTWGINLDGYSVNNVVNNNSITNLRRGISLSDCTSNIVDKNRITNCTVYSDDYAILLYHCTNSIISDNIIADNIYNGIYFVENSEENTVYKNTIINNGWGTHFRESSRNTLYHNNFVDNTNQVYDDGILPSTNTWHDGHPSGGNYWSNYASVDVKCGPNQDLPGSDGIGDTPYIIDADNVDHYPLMNPYGAPPPAEVHDIAIVNVVPSATEVYVGQTVNITVTVQNEGNFTETFEVTCKYELEGTEHIIGNMTVNNLTPQTNTSIIFNWTTTDITIHTISAYATPVPNETDTTDNNMTSPTTVKVTILGDVNCDYTINILDLVKAAGAFGAVPGSWAWNTQADIYQDGKIDIFDLVMIVLRFGKTA